ncbi:uncharacterized protein [Solanum lycopersicum]|uniref:uncharacterized protein n=1 Tax=Solanum lycopersicum TaxID=4081 RepID=UPI0037488B93
MPLWVNFPKLPLNCWGVGSLSRIASAIGVPLFADECTTKQTRISYARMLVEVNVTKAIPQKITVVDPNGKTFMQDVELEWRPQYCDKCQKIGHVCPIIQSTEQEKVEEQRQEPNRRPQEEQQEKEQEIVQKLDQQTPKNDSQTNVDGQLDLSLANFPMLKAIPTRNGFESLMHKKMTSLTIDRGGVPKTC